MRPARRRRRCASCKGWPIRDGAPSDSPLVHADASHSTSLCSQRRAVPLSLRRGRGRERLLQGAAAPRLRRATVGGGERLTDTNTGPRSTRRQQDVHVRVTKANAVAPIARFTRLCGLGPHTMAVWIAGAPQDCILLPKVDTGRAARQAGARLRRPRTAAQEHRRAARPVWARHRPGTRGMTATLLFSSVVHPTACIITGHAHMAGVCKFPCSCTISCGAERVALLRCTTALPLRLE